MQSRLHKSIFLVFLTAVSLEFSAHGDSITLSPVADTAIWERDPDFNFGGQSDIPAGSIGPRENSLRSRALFKFDLSSLPENAMIEFASLELFVVKSPQDAENSTFGLHRVLKEWGEGNKEDSVPGGEPATEGESNWLARALPDELWGAPGGLTGEDYVTEPSSTERVFGNGSYIFEFGFISVASDLQFWLENPEQNFGWMLITDMEDRGLTARRFGTRERESGSPLLTVQFSVTPSLAPPVITQIFLENGNATITFTAEQDVLYTLQTKKSLSSENWLNSATLKLTDEADELSATIYLNGETIEFFQVQADSIVTQ